jgi:hypothetical protein
MYVDRQHPLLDPDFRRRLHRRGAAPIALSNQVRYHPAPFALLNLVDLEAQYLGASKTAADE